MEKGGEVVRRWQSEKGARVVRWQGGKGGRMEKWQGGRFLVLFKSGLRCRSSTEQRSRIASRLSGMARGMEGLSIDLTQATKSSEARRYLEFVILG